MILNGTDMNLEASNMKSLGVHISGGDNRSIDLNATVALENYTTITVKCTVENLFGNDTETTTISVCSTLIVTFPKSCLRFLAHLCAIGPSQCQDGITNNCTQMCLRENGRYDCRCYPGFYLSNTIPGQCEGEFSCMQ